jgi:acyl-CoA reductase-like NAD-dependent aldehyde dehydrogenase
MYAFEEIVVSQKKYFRAGHTRPLESRKAQLKRLSLYLDQYQEELLQALRKDFAKPTFETLATELLMAKKELSHTRLCVGTQGGISGIFEIIDPKASGSSGSSND